MTNATNKYVLGLPLLGVAAPIGVGKAAVTEAILAGNRPAFRASEDLIPGRSVPVGAVAGPLPPVPHALAPFDCRNNRLLLAALAEIETEVTAAIRHYGAARVAVVVGTSTSGIAEGEAALASYRQHGRWPAGFDYRAQEAGGQRPCCR